MKKYIIPRFLLVYCAIVFLSQIVMSGIDYIQRLSMDAFRPRLVIGFFLDYFRDATERITSMLLPSADIYSILISVASCCIAVGGAVLFAEILSRQCRGLKALADQLGAVVTKTAKPSGKCFVELESKLGIIAERMEAADTARCKRQAELGEACAMLETAGTQIRVIVEAGVLDQGSAEVALIEDALAKIQEVVARVSFDTHQAQ